MLAGLIFLGVLTATALPDLMDVMRSSDDDDADAGTGDDFDHERDDTMIMEPPGDGAMEAAALAQSEEGGAGEDGPVADGAADGESDHNDESGADLFTDPGAGVTTIETFEPGVDTLTIALADEADAFELHDADDGQAPYFGYETLNGPVEIRFDGLETVPVADVFLRISDPDSPTLDADVPLSQLVADDWEDGVDGGEDSVLTPVDPTLPDDPADPGAGDAPVLSPVDPELPDDPAPMLPDGGPVLTPVQDEGVPDSAQSLAGLVQEAGASPVGIEAGATMIQTSGPDDDVISPPDTGQAGALVPSEAMAQLVSDAPLMAYDLGAGADAYTGGADPAYGFGGTGADTLTAGAGATALFGGADDDVLTGFDGPGDDAAPNALLHGGSGNDVITGGAAGEYLDGGEHGTGAFDGAAADTIHGGGGGDIIRGGAGADVLDGGDGDDLIDHRGTDAERIIAEHHEFAWHIDGANDQLAGGDGNDTLIFDQGDSVAGGAGEDIFWLYSDAADDGIAEIADFTPGEDFLRISLNPQIAGGPGIVSVVETDDGSDGLVQVDGATVAILRGAPGASPLDVYVETRADVFP